jgi:thymidylate kinase
VGADGAGKSTLVAALRHADLPQPVKTVYMGVNLEASTLMLPTTRALLAFKRRRGRRPDLVARPLGGAAAPVPAPGLGGAKRETKDLARMAVWALEEWLRQLVVLRYRAQGFVVVLDRHFYADYYFYDVAPATASRTLASRLHGWMLERLYPQPDLVICLDAPAEVLYARKPEAAPEWLEQRRQQYLALAGVVPHMVVVDATRPFDDVLRDVVNSIRTYREVVIP